LGRLKNADRVPIGGDVKALLRRIARSYQCRCAAEDMRAHGLAVPDGVWQCGQCAEVSLDLFASRVHDIAHSLVS
jgi:hypothetical protein